MSCPSPPRTQSALPPTAVIVKSRARLLRQARRMLRDRDGAEDAAQDALVCALRGLQDFRGEAQLGTWLYRLGVNAVLMSLRRQRRAAARLSRAARLSAGRPSWLHGTSEALAYRAQPLEQLEAHELARSLRRAVRELPDAYSTVVTLCDLDGRPLPEVASTLGLSVAGVRTRRLRAHRMLRQALGPQAAGWAP
ncbi:MAG: sigma-70 family RNA polymerase sigma factor [Myxococcales bacterium]|nr:sigma-70 family RNA polymerase sigma factor [Myxococcota bacterium]MDW8282018.1 sigma-70 family RNA polymerase sigma factor [Myxococcales bacterium]